MAVISGGDKLAKALAKIAANASGSLKVGFLEGSLHPESSIPNAAIAFWNEYGHQGPFPAPPRPFFRNMISNESGSWPGKLAKLLAANGNDGRAALNQLGEEIKDALQQSMTELESPELSETTKMLRKMYGNHPEEITLSSVLEAQRRVKSGEAGASGTQAKPLIWTGALKDSVDWEVS